MTHTQAGNVMSLQAFFLLFVLPAQVTGVSTTIGDYFILQYPKTMASYDIGDTIVLAFTLSNVEVNVELTSPHNNNKRKDRKFTLSRSIIQTTSFGQTHRMMESGVKSSIVLRGDGMFGVCVELFPETYTMDTFQVLPVSGFGTTYLAFTLPFNPSIIVLAAETTDVTFQLKMPTRQYTLTLEGRDYTHGSTLTVSLEKEQSYFLQLCEELSEEDQDLTGTTITGTRPIGVVSGSCSGRTLKIDCSIDLRTRDIAAEMLMPVDTYGKDFIVIDIIGRKLRGYVTVMASQPDTTITVWKDGGKQDVQIANAGDTMALTDYGRQPRKIVTNKPVSCFYMQSSNCEPVDRNGDTAVSILVPTVLFYNSYVWNSISDRDLEIFNYVTFVMQVNDRDHLRVDDTPLKTIEWANVEGDADWSVGGSSMTYNYHRAYATTGASFGCYVYGLAPSISYIHPAGYMASLINSQCQQTVSDMKAGDLIDNDCDSHVDEEIKNGQDDDNDGQADEDLVTDACRENQGTDCAEVVIQQPVVTQPPPVVTQPNVVTQQPAPCEGGDCATTQASCHTGKYGDNCEKACSNCATACDRRTGACRECKPGWRFPQSSCKTPCPVMTFGSRCSGSCDSKCSGQDCLDRVEGKCQGASFNWLYLLLLFAAVPIGLMLYLFSKVKKRGGYQFGESEMPEEKKVPESVAPEVAPDTEEGGEEEED